MLYAVCLDNMSDQNPFQIPSCFKLEIEHRRRVRFKKTVVTAVIASVGLIVGLLIEGCVSERSEVAPAQASAVARVPRASQASPAQPARQPISKNSLPMQLCPVAMEKTATPVGPPHTIGGAVYLVKSGDTLSRIAKTHGTTIKALKAANNLASDRIVVGEKLKIPAA